MVMSVMRFNCVQPGVEPGEMATRYQAFVDMAEYGDQRGASMITLEEHHGADDGWSPSPLVMAGLVFGRTKQVAATISALLLPLHDPLRVAEDIAVLDLASGGRLTTILGMGYRPEEYAAHGKDWAGRGALMDECVDTLLRAWTGEPFEHRGTTVRVTPRPLTQPHPLVLIGGTSKPAARRAARFGLPMFPAAHLPDLEAYYYEQCKEQGTQGFCMMPGADTVMTIVSRDPEKAWSELGSYPLYEATTYSGWQTPDIKSAMRSQASDAASLRSEGIYRFITPADLADELTAKGDAAACNLHPLVGGMPVDMGWESVHLYFDEVLPNVG